MATTLPQYLYRQRRAKRFRPGGMELDAFATQLADRRAQRQSALSQVQGWLSAGTGKSGEIKVIGQIIGAQVWIEYPASHAEAVTARIQELCAQQKLQRVHTATGGLCLGPAWARVRYNGVLVEIMATQGVDGSELMVDGSPQPTPDPSKEGNRAPAINQPLSTINPLFPRP